MSRDRAAYMRAYRAKDRGTPSASVEGPNLSQDLEACREEVARLKRELTLRPQATVKAIEALPEPTLGLKGGVNRRAAIEVVRDPYREFNPAPKIRTKR